MRGQFDYSACFHKGRVVNVCIILEAKKIRYVNINILFGKHDKANMYVLSSKYFI